MPRRPRKPSNFLMTIRLRLRHSWTRWLQKRTARRLSRENKRLRLLQQLLDSQLLLLTQLEEKEERLRFVQQELMESARYRTEGLLAGPPPPPPIFLPPGPPQPPQ